MVWQFVVILAQARIGRDCNINAHCFIENDVVLGDRVTVKCGVYLWDGLRVADDVFIGPNATFTNDRLPRSKQYPESFPNTVIERGASIGAAAVILPDVFLTRSPQPQWVGPIRTKSSATACTRRLSRLLLAC